MGFVYDTSQLFKVGKQEQVNGYPVQIKGFLKTAIGKIKKRLNVHGNRNIDECYNTTESENRIIIEIPTFINKTTDHDEYHRLVIQVEDRIDNPKKIEAILKRLNGKNDPIEKERPVKTDSGTAIIIAKEFSSEVIEKYGVGKLVGAGYNKGFLIQDQQPLSAYKRALRLLREFYNTRSEAIRKREEQIEATSELFSGYFGEFGNVVNAFEKHIKTIPMDLFNHIKQQFEVVFRFKAQRINNGKSAEDADIEEYRKEARKILDKITGAG